MCDKPVLVVCARCSMTSGPVVGSFRRQCKLCDADVWISTATLDIAEKQNGHIVCIECWLRIVDKLGDDKLEMTVTKGQLDEMSEELKRRNL